MLFRKDFWGWYICFLFFFYHYTAHTKRVNLEYNHRESLRLHSGPKRPQKTWLSDWSEGPGRIRRTETRWAWRLCNIATRAFAWQPWFIYAELRDGVITHIHCVISHRKPPVHNEKRRNDGQLAAEFGVDTASCSMTKKGKKKKIRIIYCPLSEVNKCEHIFLQHTIHRAFIVFNLTVGDDRSSWGVNLSISDSRHGWAESTEHNVMPPPPQKKKKTLSVGSFLNGRVKKKSNRFWEILHLACRVNHSWQLETDILSTRSVSNKSFPIN